MHNNIKPEHPGKTVPLHLRRVVPAYAGPDAPTRATGPNYQYADFSGADLQHADLRGADLRGAGLSHADLSRADLSGADLRGADLSHAVMIGTHLERVNAQHATFFLAKMEYSHCRYSDFAHAIMRAADLSDADCIYTCFAWANLIQTRLGCTRLQHANVLVVHSPIDWGETVTVDRASRTIWTDEGWLNIRQYIRRLQRDLGEHYEEEGAPLVAYIRHWMASPYTAGAYRCDSATARYPNLVVPTAPTEPSIEWPSHIKYYDAGVAS